MLIVPVKLRDLSPNPKNPRKNYSAETIKEMAASIKANGLLQPPSAKKLKGAKREIVYGNRRYHACMYLVEQGDMTLDTEINVSLFESLSDDQAAELALIENVQREDMNPIDEAEAFAVLARQGKELDEIAARVGKSAMTVRRRLAIASLCREAKNAVRKGDVSLAVAEALTIGTASQQREIVADILRGDYYDADDVRQKLLETRASVADAIFPIALYKGRIASDLFAEAENSYFDDYEQFLTLQKQAVAEKAEELRKSAAWVEVFEGWTFPSWTFEKSKAKKSGVIIHINPNGKIAIHEGLRRPEKKIAESVTVALREENAKVRPEYAEPVKRYINAHKTVAVQAAILMSPRTAREIAVAGMISYRRCVNVSVSAHGGLRFFKTNADTTSPALQKVEEEAKRFALLLGADAEDTATANDAVDFLLQSHRSDAQAYRLCKTLSNADLEALHLFLTTISFGFADLHVLDGNPSTLVNTVAADLAVNMVDNWRPDEHFLSKRNRQQLEAIIKEADTGGFMPKAKKGEMVAITAARFAAGEKEATRNWLPGAMQFPATGPDISVHHANDDDEHDAGIEDEDPETGIDEDHGEDDGEHYAEAAE